VKSHVDHKIARFHQLTGAAIKAEQTSLDIANFYNNQIIINNEFYFWIAAITSRDGDYKNFHLSNDL